VVSVVLLSPVSTYGAKTCAGQAVAARALSELPTPMTTPVAAAPIAKATVAGSSERVFGQSARGKLWAPGILLS